MSQWILCSIFSSYRCRMVSTGQLSRTDVITGQHPTAQVNIPRLLHLTLLHQLIPHLKCRCQAYRRRNEQIRFWESFGGWFMIWFIGEQKNGKMQCSYPPTSLLGNHWIFVHCTGIGCVLEAVDRCCEHAVVWNCETHPINACHDKCQVFNPKDVVHHIQSHSCTNWRWIGWMMKVWFPIVGWGANRDANQSNVRHGARWYGPDT